MLNSLAVKVLFDENNRAVGVTYIKEDTNKTITDYAKEEIILSAGAFGSSKLLMLSGIGDAKYLNNLHIPVIADVPGVGMKYKDHLQFQFTFQLKPEYYYIPGYVWNSEFVDYVKTRGGYFASQGTRMYQLFVSSHGNISSPNIQIECTLSSFTIALIIVLQKTHTEGIMRLTSADPLKPIHLEMKPLVDSDVKDLAWGVQFLRNLATVSPWKDMVESEIFPGSNITGSALEALIKSRYGNFTHFTATCPIGEVEDPYAVVDPTLHVRNVTNLRIADASVLIDNGCGNPHYTVLTFAEMASDLILKKKVHLTTVF